jgi:hypothetical protein
MAAGPSRDKGSKQHVLDLVNSPSFKVAINGLFRTADIRLSDECHRRPMGRSCWADWREYRLEGYLKEHPIKGHACPLERHWWIKHGVNCPSWDLICHLLIEGSPGLLLVEAKAHEGEMSEQDKKVLPSKATDNSKENHEQIMMRISEANDRFNELDIGQFRLSINSHYQLANRLAYLNKLACAGVPTVLLYLGWLRSPAWPKDGLRDDTHWHEVMNRYMKDVIPTAFSKQVFSPESGASMRMLIRSLDVAAVRHG